jgi:uncharacterized protein (TIGR03435 family)
MRYLIKTVIIAALLLTVTIITSAQDPPLKFEVASVKRSAMAGLGIRPNGDRFVANVMTLHDLIGFAYWPCDGRPLLDNQIAGAPGWVDADRFDIEAKADGGGQPIPPCEMRLMLQSLLAERFQLKAHFETRELPIFNLVVTKAGKMTLSPDQTPLGPRPPFDPSAPPPRGILITKSGPPTTTISGTAIPMDRLVNALLGSSPEARDRPLIDRTGLKGLFDVHLEFTNESSRAGLPSDPAGPSLFTAIQEQLGLKFEAAKGPVDVLVIDSVQRPTEN